MKFYHLFFIGFFWAAIANADYFELGLSGNFKKSFLSDSDAAQKAYDQAYAFTGSVAYYFREMTALEFSYTEGQAKRSIPSTPISSTTTHSYSMLGTDLLFTFGKRQDTYIPYLKGGLAFFLKKRIDYNYVNSVTPGSDQKSSVDLDRSVVPSAGLGIQIRMTQELSLKTGLEFWTVGPLNKSLSAFDWAAKFGISLFL